MENPELASLAFQIETELKRIGFWKSDPIVPPSSLGAFGADGLTFEEWLQLVFLPGLRKAAQGVGIPNKSQVTVAAIRNWDGLDNTDELISLLSRVDDIVNSGQMANREMG